MVPNTTHPTLLGVGLLSIACVGGDELLMQCERLEAQLKACVLPVETCRGAGGGWLGWLALVLFLSSREK